jgi:thiol:disulfide interchange protein
VRQDRGRHIRSGWLEKPPRAVELSPLRLVAAAVACILLAVPAIAETPQADTNRLIHSASPYLLQHAHNPVEWYPWGEEALAKAKRENKPIFVSVGYSTCYWCHVAERTIYSNPAIAALMNRFGRMAEQSVPDARPQALLCRQLLPSRRSPGRRRLSDHSQADP